MSDAPFVPESYVSHTEGWAAAYISIYGQIEDDPELAPYRDKAERAKKEKIEELRGVMAKPARTAQRQRDELQVAKSALIKVNVDWWKPEIYLFREIGDHIRTARKLNVRNALLKKLCAGAIKGYSPVMLSQHAKRMHSMRKMPMPGVVDPIDQLGIWASDAGVTAIESGRVHWAFSEYDNVTERWLFFSGQELEECFPAYRPPETDNLPSRTIPQEIARVLQKRYRDGLPAARGSIAQAKREVESELGKKLPNSTWDRGLIRYRRVRES